MNLPYFLHTNNIAFQENVNLQQFTWLHRGGIAKLYITPATSDELVLVCKECYSSSIPFLLIGYTTNLYIKNSTDLPVVISTSLLQSIQIENTYYQVECGVAIAKLAQMAIHDGCHGYEGLTSLPGAVGSALVNNAGCFNCLVSDNLIQAQVLLPSGELATWYPEDFDWTERSSSIKRKEKTGIILSAQLKRECTEDQQYLQSQAQTYTQIRKQTQEAPAKTLGSCFPASTFAAFVHNLPLVLKVVYYYFPKKWSKYIILLWYRAICLSPYISDRNVNCYIWKDEQADLYFEKYVQLFTRVSQCHEIEIEII